tara:strand:- start:1610 stop:2497 length:888 start_codon:yes stop_codon:yes gene_type:complete
MIISSLNKSKIRILIVGSNGMLGHMLFDYFTAQDGFETIGLSRNVINGFINEKNIIKEENLTNPDIINSLIDKVRPNLVINCVGMIKQNPNISNIEESFYLNSFFPKILSQICKIKKIRFLTFSTDCVFSGKKGFYKEDDLVDIQDLYGQSKYLGEVNDSDNTITLRTSIIGKELNTKRGLLEWLLSQSKLNKKVYGFKNVIFSGFPTIEVARIIHKYIIPNNDLKGIYHLSSDPIDKYSLLNLIKRFYSLDVMIIAEYDNVINRSLDSSKFRFETGFIPYDWEYLVQSMYENNL